jgi:hypothetical protein
MLLLLSRAKTRPFFVLHVLEPSRLSESSAPLVTFSGSPLLYL